MAKDEKDKKPSNRIDPDSEQCSNCGLTKHLDWWETLCCDIYLYHKNDKRKSNEY